MWNAFFGTSTPLPKVSDNAKDTGSSLSNESDGELIVYLMDGTLRVPCVLPKKHTKNVVSLRQWVFDTIARLPNEEEVESYTFKVLPDNYVYWYMRRVSDACTNSPANYSGTSGYGVLMKYVDGCFTGIADRNATLPPVPQSAPAEPPTNTGTSAPSNNSNTLLVVTPFVDEEVRTTTTTPTTRSKRAPAKRLRK